MQSIELSLRWEMMSLCRLSLSISTRRRRKLCAGCYLLHRDEISSYFLCDHHRRPFPTSIFSLSIPFHPRQLALALFHFSIKNEKNLQVLFALTCQLDEFEDKHRHREKYSRKKQSQAKADDTVDKQKMLCSKNKVKKNVYSTEDVSQEFLGRSLSPHCLRIPFLLPACRLRCVECAAEEKRERDTVYPGDPNSTFEPMPTVLKQKNALISLSSSSSNRRGREKKRKLSAPESTTAEKFQWDFTALFLAHSFIIGF